MLTVGIMPPLVQRRIGIALIGLGQQGLRLLEELLQLQANYPLDILALSDVQQPALATAARLIPDAYFTSDYETALSQQGVNAVLIATPDASHALLAETVLNWGYDLYIEPPLARNTQTVQRLGWLAAQNKSIIQLGMEDIRDTRFTLARRLIQTGLFGKITRVEVSVTSPKWRTGKRTDAKNGLDWDKFLLGASHRPFNPHLLNNWALFNDFSDGYALQHLSRVAELLRYMLDAQAPSRVVADGGNFIWQDSRTNPDSFQAVLTYREGFLLSFSMGLGGERFILYGTQGSIDLIKREVITENAVQSPIPQPLAKSLSEELVAAKYHNPLNAHLNNWLAAVQYRHLPRLGIDAAYRQAALVEAVLQNYQGDMGA